MHVHAGIRRKSAVLTFFGLSVRRLGAVPSMAFASFFIILLTGSGLSYAADSAVPGDILYPLKVRVTEPIRGTFALDAESKAQWQTTLANRRLAEAEQLAIQGKLTPDKQELIQAELANETGSFDTIVNTLNSQPNSAVAIATAQSLLEASLTAHTQILTAIASSTTNADSQVRPILASVITQASSARQGRLKAYRTILANASTSELAASTDERVALTNLNDLTDALPVMVVATATTSSIIDSDASATQQAIVNGKSNYQSGDYQQAFEAFQSALRAARETVIEAQAQANLGITITKPSLDVLEASSTQIASTTSSTR